MKHPSPRLKKLIGFAVLSAALVLMTVLFASCTTLKKPIGLTFNGPSTFDAEIGEFDLSSVSFTVNYNDGTSNDYTLTEEMVPAAELLKLYKVGKQTLTFTVGDATGSFVVNVSRHTFDPSVYSFDGTTVTVEYDGAPHTLAIRGEIPEGVRIRYPDGNTFVDVGTYPVRAVLTKNGFDTEEMNATLVITEKTVDLSSVTFEDQSVTFDGAEHMITASNLPAGVTVSYKIRSENGDREYFSAIAPGIYQIQATFTSNNVNCRLVNPPEAAILTINRKDYPAFSLGMEDMTVVYDGDPHAITLTTEQLAKAPDGVECEFSWGKLDADGIWWPMDDDPVDAGVYEYHADFYGDTRNYNFIPEQKATLTIEKKKIDVAYILFHSDRVTYDGELHTVTVDESTVPDMLEIGYSVIRYGEDGEVIEEEGTSFSHVGTYTFVVRAKVRSVFDKNYAILQGDELFATLIIDPMQTSVPVVPQDIRFDPVDGFVLTDAKLATLDPDLSATVTVTDADGAVVTAPEHGEVYHYSVAFRFTDEKKNLDVLIDEASGTVSFLTADLAEALRAYFAEAAAAGSDEYIPTSLTKSYGTSYEYALGSTPDCRARLTDAFSRVTPENWFGVVSVSLIPVDATGADSGDPVTASDPLHPGDYRAVFTLSECDQYGASDNTGYSVFVTVLPIDLSGAFNLAGKEIVFNPGDDLAEDMYGAINKTLTEDLKVSGDWLLTAYDLNGASPVKVIKVNSVGSFKVHVDFGSSDYLPLDFPFTVVPRYVSFADLINATTVRTFSFVYNNLEFHGERLPESVRSCVTVSDDVVSADIAKATVTVTFKLAFGSRSADNCYLLPESDAELADMVSRYGYGGARVLGTGTEEGEYYWVRVSYQKIVEI